VICLSVECREYCQFEAFNATCPTGQLVVVEHARYGRQRLGRCVTRDYGFIGCTANVIELLDAVCTGRRWCEVPVPSLRRRVQPCPKDLTAYLDATYHCIDGPSTDHTYFSRLLSLRLTFFSFFLFDSVRCTNAVVTTVIRLRFDGRSTTVRLIIRGRSCHTDVIR